MEKSKWIRFGILFVLSSVQVVYSQTIDIEFSKFAGKTYDFIIFQGKEVVKIHENDIIPENGLVKIVIPKEYAPYTGMCRWLITSSAEGGGLDLAIPGYGFKVSCLSARPDETNIHYTGFDAVNELNRLNIEQQAIIDKFETMSKATQLYDSNHALYQTFSKEMIVQAQAFEQFRQDLKKNINYNAKFLPILWLVRGVPPRLTANYKLTAKFVNEYIVNELDYDHLYTSGHWTSIIQSWVQIHVQMHQDKSVFVSDFNTISHRISEPKQYTDFVEEVTYYLTQMGKDEFITGIAPTVINSDKITTYEGKTMQVYVTAKVGSQAPDLVITEYIGAVENHNHQTKFLRSNELALEDYQQTLLVFYQSGCGPCEVLMQKLPSQYAALKEKRVRLVSISADVSEQVFKNSSNLYPWPDKYCDFEGINGINFKNYGVQGTPTIVLLDKMGKIVRKGASIQDIWELL